MKRWERDEYLPAPGESERALTLNRKAREDATAVREFSANAEISDAIIGFHAQQAIEKWLKTVLILRGASYKPVHDIAYLIELLEAVGGDLPPDQDALIALTDYAVPMRYDELLDSEPLDRPKAVSLIDEVSRWATVQLPESDS